MAPKSPTVRTTRRRLRAVEPGIETSVSAGALDEHLPALASLLEQHTYAVDQGPQIVRITAAGLTHDGIDVGLRAIDDIDRSVVDALAGFTAPSDWLAIGVSTGGKAHAIDGSAAETRRVRLVHLVTRGGACASVVRLGADEPQLLTPADAGPASGRIDDVCRRALGLSTAPAPSTLELWALQWLDRLVECGTEAAPAAWQQMASMHPAVRAVAEAEPELVPEAATRLVRLGRIFAEINDWAALRAACGAGDWPASDVPPAVARWLDDGAFSRWVTGGYPSVEQLAAAACDLVEPVHARRLRATLREWELGSFSSRS